MTAPATTAPVSRGRLAPSPPATPVFGHALPFQRDPLGYLLATAHTCGPVARLKLGPLTYHLVSDPALVAEVLQERASNYLRDTRSSRNIRLVTGESLLSSEGDNWRRHRRLAQPIFHQRRIAAFAEVMARAAAETASAWETAARAGTTLDLASEMSRLTFTVVGRCLFGAELGPQAGEVETAFPVLLDELFFRAKHAFSLPVWMPLPRHRRFKHALGVIDRVVNRIIVARRSQAAAGEDLLGLLLDARDEDGSALTDEEIRHQIVTFLLAGHETTASTLTWTFALLAQNADEQHALETELDRVLSGPGATGLPDWQTLPALTRLNAVLHESLRLYPTIWISERRVVAADVLGGFRIPPGSSVVVSPYVTHRLAASWPDPEAFKPNRFNDGEARTLVRDGYFPFGTGPHTCIGQHFAMMEAKIILATLAGRFRVRLESGTMPTPLGGITLRPADAVRIHVERRCASAKVFG